MGEWKHTVCPCGAHMLWAVSVNGKPQPFDAALSEKGNVVMEDQKEGPPLARVLKAAELAERRDAAAKSGEVLKLYIAHHATCPRAKEFHAKGNRGSATQAGVFGTLPA